MHGELALALYTNRYLLLTRLGYPGWARRPAYPDGAGKGEWMLLDGPGQMTWSNSNDGFWMIWCQRCGANVGCDTSVEAREMAREHEQRCLVRGAPRREGRRVSDIWLDRGAERMEAAVMSDRDSPHDDSTLGRQEPASGGTRRLGHGEALGHELGGEAVHQPEEIFQLKSGEALGAAVHAYDVGIVVRSVLRPTHGAVTTLGHGSAAKDDGRRPEVCRIGKFFRIYRQHLHPRAQGGYGLGYGLGVGAWL